MTTINFIARHVVLDAPINVSIFFFGRPNGDVNGAYISPQNVESSRKSPSDPGYVVGTKDPNYVSPTNVSENISRLQDQIFHISYHYFFTYINKRFT